MQVDRSASALAFALAFAVAELAGAAVVYVAAHLW